MFNYFCFDDLGTVQDYIVLSSTVLCYLVLPRSPGLHCTIQYCPVLLGTAQESRITLYYPVPSWATWYCPGVQDYIVLSSTVLCYLVLPRSPGLPCTIQYRPGLLGTAHESRITLYYPVPSCATWYCPGLPCTIQYCPGLLGTAQESRITLYYPVPSWATWYCPGVQNYLVLSSTALCYLVLPGTTWYYLVLLGTNQCYLELQ